MTATTVQATTSGMVTAHDEGGNSPRDIPGGLLLLGSAIAMAGVLALHPHGHQIADPLDGESAARLNRLVHGVALAAIPVLFLGLLALLRRLGDSGLARAALVGHGFALVAVLSAAVVSGFASTAMLERVAGAQGAERETFAALADFGFHLNQGFATVDVVASCVAVLLWSAAILRTARLPAALGWLGLVASALLLVAFAVGHLRPDVHGFGLLTFVQSAWLAAVGVALCRGRRLRG